MLKQFYRVFRSAVTGRFVTKDYATQNPVETVSERRETQNRSSNSTSADSDSTGTPQT